MAHVISLPRKTISQSWTALKSTTPITCDNGSVGGGSWAVGWLVGRLVYFARDIGCDSDGVSETFCAVLELLKFWSKVML